MKSLPPPCPSLVVATAEGTLRLLDSRSPLAYQNELKVSFVQFPAPSIHQDRTLLSRIGALRSKGLGQSSGLF